MAKRIILGMDPDPHIPNRPGLAVEVIAWTGDFDPQTHKRYNCKSHRVRVDPTIYTPEVKAKLEHGTAWEIFDTSRVTVPEKPKSSWETVRRARFQLCFPETENAWPIIHRVIREDFSKRAKVNAEARLIDYEASTDKKEP